MSLLIQKKYIKLLYFIFILSCMLPGILNAAIIKVPADIPTVWGALQAASEGDEIIVSPGTYVENIYIGATETRPPINVVLRSTNPSDPAIVDSTIIKAKGPWAVVTFHGTEKTTCRLDGFTISSGGSLSHPYGGGINGNGTVAVIQNCVITKNSATYGAGLSNCDGLIKNCRITNNVAAADGGGLYACRGTIMFNTISGNSANKRADSNGGGLNSCTATIINNVITQNSAAHFGGGLYYCPGLIQNNIIANNTASGVGEGSGGGLYYSMGTVQNNTIAYNVAKTKGGGISISKGFIVNNIIWGNTAPNGAQVFDISSPTYSCIQYWYLGGKGNISSDPKFVDITNKNYHLNTGSPCINAGNTGYLVGNFLADVDGECRVAGRSVDIGADEYGSSKDRDGDLLSDIDEFTYGTIYSNPDTDGDGLMDGKEVMRNLSPTFFNKPVGINIPSFSSSIQLGIFLAFPLEKITVAPGVYNENLRFLGKNITLSSSNPINYQTVIDTVIDGNGAGPVMIFDGTETNTCFIEGFTIRNGYGSNGGGISGNGTYAEFRYNRVIGNVAIYNGGGFYLCHGLIRNNLVASNKAFNNGGGFAECWGTLSNNITTTNTAALFGGGMFSCNGKLYNNTIADNRAADYAFSQGGGIASCAAEIYNCILWGNHAPTYPQITEDCLTPAFSCIEGWGSLGILNTNKDPKFAEPLAWDYHLRSGSSCIDKGRREEAYNDACRPPGRGILRNDIGAYGGPYNCGWSHITSRNILDYLLGKITLNIEQKYIADQNGDYYIDIADAIILMQRGE